MTAHHHHHHLPHDEKSGGGGSTPIITATGKVAPPPTTSNLGGDDNSSSGGGRKRRRRRRPMIGPAVWAAFKEEQRVGRVAVINVAADTPCYGRLSCLELGRSTTAVTGCVSASLVYVAPRMGGASVCVLYGYVRPLQTLPSKSKFSRHVTCRYKR